MSKQTENSDCAHSSREEIMESTTSPSLPYCEADTSSENKNCSLQRKVTNPFRLRQMARAKAAAEEGFNQEFMKAEDTTREPVVQPPPKAVFTDLQSAHQSITTRTGRLRTGTITHRTGVSKLQETVQDGQAYESHSGEFSVQPLTLYASRHKAEELMQTTEDFEDIDLGPSVVRRPAEQFEIQDEPTLQRRPSVIATVTTYIRSALVFPREQRAVGGENVYNRPSQSLKKSPDGCCDYENSRSDSNTASFDHINRLPHDQLSLPPGQFSSSPAPANQWLQTQPVASGTSSMERSTIGEIYKHYEAARSPPERRAGCPEHEVESQESEDTSYGDSEILFGDRVNDEDYRVVQAEAEDQLAPPPVILFESARSENTLSVGAVSTVPSLTEVNWRHRYSTYPDSRLAREESIKSMCSEISRVTSLDPQMEEPGNNRLPLEREISQELRRVSAISEDGFPDSQDNVFQAQNNALSNGRRYLLAPRSLYDNSDGLGSSSSSNADTVRAQAFQEQPDPCFYNPDAISPHWVGFDQEIRVPIQPPPIPNRSPRRPPPPPSAPAPTVAPVIRKSHDEEEWQTVGGSAWETESRAASSHADTSEHSYISRLSADGYGSSERIARHPAPIAGCSNFRRRDMAGNRPVLLPIHNEYLVNGYPANSSRVRPAALPYQVPMPLSQRHENPFSSSPPEVLSPTKTSKTSKPSGFMARARNLFPMSNSTLSTDCSGTTARRPDSRKAQDPVDRARRFSNTTDWMRNPANFIVHPPVSSPLQSSTDRPSSYEFVQSLADSEELQDFRPYGSHPVQARGQTDGTLQNPVEVAQGPRRMPSRRDAPAGEFKYRSPLAPPKARVAREIYTEDQLFDIEHMAGYSGPPNGGIVSTASQGPSQRHLDEFPILNLFVPDPADHRRKLAWNRSCLALCALFPPMLLCMTAGAFDHLFRRWSKGKLQEVSSRYKVTAFVLFMLETALLVILVVVIIANTKPEELF